MAEEKEIVLDLSGKIKFSSTLYISVGTLLLTGLISIIQLLICLASNNWIWSQDAFIVFLNLIYAIRSEEKKVDDD